MSAAEFWPKVLESSGDVLVVASKSATRHAAREVLAPFLGQSRQEETEPALKLTGHLEGSHLSECLGALEPRSDLLPTISAEVNEAEIIRQTMKRVYRLGELAKEEGMRPPSAEIAAQLREVIGRIPERFSASKDHLPGIFLTDEGGLEIVFESPTTLRRSELVASLDSPLQLWTSDGRSSQPRERTLEGFVSAIEEGFRFVWSDE